MFGFTSRFPYVCTAFPGKMYKNYLVDFFSIGHTNPLGGADVPYRVYNFDLLKLPTISHSKPNMSVIWQTESDS